MRRKSEKRTKRHIVNQILREQEKRNDPLSDLSSAWLNAERGIRVSQYSDTRERRTRFTKCKNCQKTWNPCSETIESVEDTDSVPYSYAPGYLFKRDELCRDCLSDIEHK